MKNQHGFTLIELMATLAVGAILMAVAIPSFRSIVQNGRITSEANELIASLNIARSEAVKRRRLVSLCVSSDGATCTGNNWATGWLVWSDDNSNGVLNAGETLKVYPTLTGGSTLVEAGGATSVQYRWSGVANRTMTYNLSIPGCTLDQARQITVALVGLVTSARVNCP